MYIQYILYTVDAVKYRLTLIQQCKNEPFEEALVRKTTTDRTRLRKGSYLPRLVSMRGEGREERKALRNSRGKSIINTWHRNDL